jgi:hypothetical protein
VHDIPNQSWLPPTILPYSRHLERYYAFRAAKDHLVHTFSAKIAPIAPTASDLHCRKYLDKHRRAKIRRIGRFNRVGATCQVALQNINQKQ